MQITDDAVNKVATIVANNIGSKVLDGINWALILDKPTINEYENIRQTLKDMGYVKGEVLRAFAAPNGFIYDIDASVTKRLLLNIMQNSEDLNLCSNMIETAYEERRNAEFTHMQLFLINAIKSGKTKVSVALFNTNSGHKITYKTYIENGKYAGQRVEISLPAFALRHWDLQELNQNYLIPAKLKIARVQVVEILPTRTGVGFNLELVKLDE